MNDWTEKELDDLQAELSKLSRNGDALATAYWIRMRFAESHCARVAVANDLKDHFEKVMAIIEKWWSGIKLATGLVSEGE